MCIQCLVWTNRLSSSSVSWYITPGAISSSQKNAYLPGSSPTSPKRNLSSFNKNRYKILALLCPVLCPVLHSKQGSVLDVIANEWSRRVEILLVVPVPLFLPLLSFTERSLRPHALLQARSQFQLAVLETPRACTRERRLPSAAGAGFQFFVCRACVAQASPSESAQCE